MLRVVYVASTRRMAEALQQALSDNGLLASIRSINAEAEGPCEILVPVSEIEEAVEIINDNLCRLGKVNR
jgi:hypothetical protein